MVEFGKQFGNFIKKLNTNSRHKLAVPLLGVSPGEMKMFVHRKTCTPTFIAPLFVIIPNENHPNVHHLVNGQVKCGLSMRWDIIQ